MKILHVVTGLREASGVSLFCRELSYEQILRGHEVSFVVQDAWRDDGVVLDDKVRLVDIEAFLDAWRTAEFDIVHFHGVWELMLHRMVDVCRKKKWRIVWSPHGFLLPAALSIHPFKKRIAWYLYQKRDMLSACAFHVTADEEGNAVRRLIPGATVVQAPLGIREDCFDSHVSRDRFDTKTVLFVSRLQHNKGVENLIRAWASLLSNDRFISRNWKLRIVGPDVNGYLNKLQNLVCELDVADTVCFVGAKYGKALRAEYAAASLFVLPSFSENFGSVVLEALIAGVPVITTKNTPWRSLADSRCGWWIDIGVFPLCDALHTALSLSPQALSAMGQRGRDMALRDFSWRNVAEKIDEMYEKIVKNEKE